MKFIETSIFTRQILELLTDAEYRALQCSLWERPDRGILIKGSGGIRKIRVASRGKGKSGGVRVIYYWITLQEQIYMLPAYPKSKKDDLTAGELAMLNALIRKELEDG
jgi:hypothetical protein